MRLLAIGFSLFISISLPSNELTNEQKSRYLERLNNLSDKYKDTEVPCDYEITLWMNIGAAMGANLPDWAPPVQANHSQSFYKYTYRNSDFRYLPDTTYVFKILMKMEVQGGYTKTEAVTVYYEKTGAEFKTDWISAGTLSKREIEKIGWRGGGNSVPYSEGKCLIKRITSDFK